MAVYHAVAEFGSNQWAIELSKRDRVQSESVCFSVRGRSSKEEVEEEIEQFVAMYFDSTLSPGDIPLTVEWKGVGEHRQWLERYLAWRARDRGRDPPPGHTKRAAGEDAAPRYHAVAEFGPNEWVIQRSKGDRISREVSSFRCAGRYTKEEVHKQIESILLIEWDGPFAPKAPPWEMVLTVEWKGEAVHREWLAAWRGRRERGEEDEDEDIYA